MTDSERAAMRSDKNALENALIELGAVRQGNKFLCCFHKEKTGSLEIFQHEDGHYAFKCFGCGKSGDYFDAVAAAKGVAPGVVMKAMTTTHTTPPPKQEKPMRVYADLDELTKAAQFAAPKHPELTEINCYTHPDTANADMVVFKLVDAAGGKTFRQGHQAADGWRLCAPPKPWPLLNRIGLRDADAVVVVEGEKCARLLIELGFVATTAPGGASNGHHADWTPLKGKKCYLWPDNDAGGLAHMRYVADTLLAFNSTTEVYWLEPKEHGLGEKEDVADFLPKSGATTPEEQRGLLNDMLEGSPRYVTPVEDDGGWSISQLLAYDTERDDNTLLGRRYLCKGGGLMLFGATGRGKSSVVVQAALQWALGEPFFGITPAKPLKSIIIQAENDIGDTSEMIRGVLNGVPLADRAAELEPMVRVYRQCQLTKEAFALYMKGLILKTKPDIVVIDPLFSYLGGDINSAQDVGHLLRNLLNPIALDTGVAFVIVHHTPKPPRTSQYKNAYMASDYSYAGAGSAEMSNWARAVIGIHEVEDGVFELRASKRGERSGLTDAEGNVVKREPIHLRHGDHGICWERAEAPKNPKTEADRAQSEEILSLIPQTGMTYSELKTLVIASKKCTPGAAEQYITRKLAQFTKIFAKRYYTK